MSFIDVDDLAALLPDLIADALRTKDTRPVTPSDHITKTSGVVEGIDGFTALVQLDDDRPGHITPVQMAAQVAIGDRPVILVSPNGGMVIVGNGGLSGLGTGGGTETGPGLGPGVHIPASALDRWKIAARPPRTTLQIALDASQTTLWPIDPRQFPARDWTRFAPRQRADGSGTWPTLFPVWVDDEMMAVTNGVGFVRLTDVNAGIDAGTFDLSAGPFAGSGTFAPPTGFKTGGTGVLHVDGLGSKNPAGGILFVHCSYFNTSILTYTGSTATSFTGCTHQATLTWHGPTSISSKPEIGSEVTAPWTVQRAVGGTTAVAHALGAVVRGAARNDVVFIGDSITIPFGGDESFILGVSNGTDWRLKVTMPTFADGWGEGLARALGSQGAGFRYVGRSDEWLVSSFTPPPYAIVPPQPGWFDVALEGRGAVSALPDESPFDLFPFLGSPANPIFPSGHYAITAVGSNHTATWKPPAPFTGTLDIVIVENASSGNFSYRANSAGPWSEVAVDAPVYPRLARKTITVSAASSLTIRCADGSGAATNLVLGGVIPYEGDATILAHNLARGGSTLLELTRPFGTVGGSNGEYDGMRMLDGDPQSIFPSLVVAEFSNDANRIAAIGLDAAVAEWVASWTSFVTRVGPYADILVVLCANQDRTTIPVGGGGVQVTDDGQQAFRDAAKTYLLANKVAVLDLAEAWTADYSTTTPAEIWAAGLIGDRAIKLHPTAKGYADIAARLARIVSVTGSAGATPGVTGPEVLAQFSASGVVIPTPTSKIWTLTTAGQIGGAILTMGTPPLPGRSCVVDVRLNGVSLWADPADRPTFTNTTVNPLVVQPDGGAKSYSALDLLTAYVVDGGSGRDLEVLVVTDAAGSHGDSGGGGGGGGPKTAKWDEFIWDDGTIWA